MQYRKKRTFKDTFNDKCDLLNCIFQVKREILAYNCRHVIPHRFFFPSRWFPPKKLDWSEVARAVCIAHGRQPIPRPTPLVRLRRLLQREKGFF